MPRRRFLSFLGCLAAASPVFIAAPSSLAFVVQDVPEAYRLRVANTVHGAVELSADKGKTWKVVARVSRPALKVGTGTGGTLPAVLRTSKYGLAFSAGANQEVRILSDSAQTRSDSSAILVNVSTAFTLFKDFLPPATSPVQIVVERVVSPLGLPYSPRDGDVLLFTAQKSDIAADKVTAYITDAAERYRDMAIARVRAKGEKIISGFLTVNAKLENEDVPSAVTFAVDGQVMSIMNRPPYMMRYDTRPWEKGEHLIEVKALDKSGAVLRQSKTLVVVDNTLTGT
jgi:hypothetical protein